MVMCMYSDKRRLLFEQFRTHGAISIVVPSCNGSIYSLVSLECCDLKELCGNYNETFQALRLRC